MGHAKLQMTLPFILAIHHVERLIDTKLEQMLILMALYDVGVFGLTGILLMNI